MAVPWGPIISAGATLLGGLFGKDEETTSRVDYKQMVKDAEAAGFNPLTAIRNGGSAGYTATSHPALSSGAYIADAIGQIGSAIASIDPMAEETARLEHEIREATLANLQADTAARLRASIGGVPTSAGASVVKPRNLYEAWTDNSAQGGNRTVYLPSQDLPDLDQLIVPSVGAVGNDIVRGAGAIAGGSATPPPVAPQVTVGDVMGGVRSVYDWWNSKADAEYADHKRRFQ